MKLEVGRRAQRQAQRIEEWWARNRPDVPDLFTDELAEVFLQITERRGVGVGWPTRRRPDLRRILMPKTGNHVYFRVDEKKQLVSVLAVWGGPRGTTPQL